MVAPVSGTVRRHNEAVLIRPALINEDPLEHWLVELEPEDLEDELELLLHDRELVRAWFELEIQRFRDQGMVAQ